MDAEEFLKMIKDSRDGYSDEIPLEILHSIMVVDGKQITYKYKVRKGWF